MKKQIEQNEYFPDIAFGFFIIVLLLGLEYVLGAALADLDSALRFGSHQFSSIIVVISTGIIVSILMSYKKITYATIFNPEKTTRLPIIIATFIPIFLLISAASLWVKELTNFLDYIFKPGKPQNVQNYPLGYLAVEFIASCVVAPVIEEILFRGIILRSFLNQYDPKKAIIWSAIIFAIAHLNLYQLPVAFVGGCMIGWIYYRTKSLWLCILAHAFHNTIMTFQYYYTNAYTQNMSFISSKITIAVSILLTIILVLWVEKIIRKQEK